MVSTAECPYINANWVVDDEDTNFAPQTFIMTQAPITNTIPDFFQVIWTYNIMTVAMLTNLIEYGMVKATQYWPDKLNESIAFGRWTIEMVEEISNTSFVMREIKFYETNSKGEQKTFKMFHYNGWNDLNSPSDPQDFSKFVSAIQKNQNRHQ